MKRKIGIVFLIIILLGAGGIWFFRQLFPRSTGIWQAEQKKDLGAPEDYFGYEKGKFWWISNFAGPQKICFDIMTKKNLDDSTKKLSFKQTVRAKEFLTEGTLDDLIKNNSAEAIREKIINGRPFLMVGMENNLLREGKNLFFAVTPDKFLFPTVNIFNYYFPGEKMPVNQSENQSLAYSNKLIGLPEGVLISRGQGVFAVSAGELTLIRSPQIFESMGYHWEEVKGLNDFETKINKVSSEKNFGLNFTHPNGTIIRDQKNLFLVWEGSLWQLTAEEKDRYFLAQPTVEVKEKRGDLNCNLIGKKINCCLQNFDPRIDGKNNYPFSNTIVIDVEQAFGSEIQKVEWSSEVIFNKENLMKRLISLSNYILYTTGIKK